MAFAGQNLMLILGALVNQDHTANGIIEAVRAATGGKARLGTGGIYTQLERLERQGLVKGYYGTEKPPERKGRPRRYYRIKAKGHAALNQLDLVRAATQGG